MPDNVVLNAGAGGETLATDANASTEHYQLVKLVTGALGTFNLVSTAAPVPIQGSTAGDILPTSVVTSSGAYVPTSTSAGLLVNTSTATVATRILSTASGWGAAQTVTSTSAVISTGSGWGSAQTVTSTSVVVSTGSGWGATPNVVGTTGGFFPVNVVTSSGAYVPVSTSAGLLVNTSTATIPTRVVTTSAGWGSAQTVTSTSVVLSSAGLTQISGIPTAVVTTSAGWGATPTVTSTAVTLSSSGRTIVEARGAVTTSGLTPYVYWSSGTPAVGVNATTSPLSLFGWAVYNSTAAIRSAKIYASTAPTVGSTSTLLVAVEVPGSTGGGGSNMLILPAGVYSSVGLSVVVTANANATDTGAPGLNDVSYNLFYQV